MDRISSQTRSAILLESLYYLDKYENYRISLYESLVTANRIKIDFDFSTRFINISAIMPIDSVDLTKPITSPERVVFPVWNTEIEVVDVVSYVIIPGYTQMVSYERNEETGETTLILDHIPATTIEVVTPTLVYSTVLTMQELDIVRPVPRKNIQITLDEPNLKAIIEAILPFDCFIDSEGRTVVIPLDD